MHITGGVLVRGYQHPHNVHQRKSFSSRLTPERVATLVLKSGSLSHCEFMPSGRYLQAPI